MKTRETHLSSSKGTHFGFFTFQTQLTKPNLFDNNSPPFDICSALGVFFGNFLNLPRVPRLDLYFLIVA